MLAVVMPLALVCMISGHSILRDDEVRDYMTLANCVGVLALLLAYAGGAYFGRVARFPALATAPVPNLYMDFTFLLTFMAYLVWFAPFFRNPDLLLAVLAGIPGAVYDAREQIQTTPGLTTFTQAGVAYVCLYVGRDNMETAPLRRHVVFLALIIGLGVLRAFLRSERLAVLELVIPLLIAFALRHRRSKLVALGPFLGLFVLYGFFAVTEYLRSWTNTYAEQGESLAFFVFERIQKYYLYSLNNGLGLIHSKTQGTSPAIVFFSLEWLYKFPIVGPMITSSIHIVDPVEPFLDRFQNPELNSFAEVVDLAYDFGWLGGLLANTLIGFVTGMSFQSMMVRRGLLRFYYPLLLVGALEFIRISYLSTGRTFPIYILLLAPFLFSGRGLNLGELRTAMQRR